MKPMVLIFCLFSFAVLTGCGGSGNPIPPVPPPSNAFSNASFSGHYTFLMKGTNTGGTFREAGVLTSDGAGNITAGTDDFTQGGSVATTSFTGTYQINTDGTGNATFNFANGTSNVFELALSSVNQAYIIEADTSANSGGTLDLQSTGDFALPNGTYVFEWQGFQAGPTLSGSVGTFTTAGASFSGSEDVDQGGTLNSAVTFSGSFTAPDATGRGTGSMGDSLGATTHFFYYVVNKNSLRLLSSDADIRLQGRAERRTANTFDDTSLAGNFAFGSHGDTFANAGGAQTVGQFTSDGSGRITTASIDSVQDGTVSSNLGFTGSYIVGTDGRAIINFQPTNAAVQEIVWIVTPSRAFFLINDPSKVELGTIDQQSSASFSNSDFNGTYAVIMDGFDTTSVVDRIGTIQANGTGCLVLNELVNRAGIVSTPGALGGKFSVISPNGRILASVNSISNNFVIYLITGKGNGANNAYLLQADPIAEISGTTAFQIIP